LFGNPYKKLKMLIATKLSLGDARREKENGRIPAVSVLLRHRLIIDEAGLEAVLCLNTNVGNQLLYISMRFSIAA
jgi:hypothetical protein